MHDTKKWSHKCHKHHSIHKSEVMYAGKQECLLPAPGSGLTMIWICLHCCAFLVFYLTSFISLTNSNICSQYKLTPPLPAEALFLRCSHFAYLSPRVSSPEVLRMCFLLCSWFPVGWCFPAELSDFPNHSVFCPPPFSFSPLIQPTQPFSFRVLLICLGVCRSLHWDTLFEGTDIIPFIGFSWLWMGIAGGQHAATRESEHLYLQLEATTEADLEGFSSPAALVFSKACVYNGLSSVCCIHEKGNVRKSVMCSVTMKCSLWFT